MSLTGNNKCLGVFILCHNQIVRFVCEVYKYLDHFPSEARDKLNQVYMVHIMALKEDRFGCLVRKSKCGWM